MNFNISGKLDIMRRLTEAERLRAIGMLQTGSTKVQTTNFINISVCYQSVVGMLSEV